jgi:hypothetical protein
MRHNQIRDTTGRFENKYALPEDVAAQILDYSRRFLPPDRGEDGIQQITSLYLETPELTFYRWHNEGREDRFKLRVRGYGNMPVATVYLEIKRKSGDLVRKHRAEVAVPQMDSVLMGLGRGGSPELREFVKTFREFGAQARMLVRYVRTACREHKGDVETAVTADRKIVCQPVSTYDLTGDPAAWRPVVLPVHGATMLELKYVKRPPAWMAAIMSDIIEHRVRFSKYAAAMEQYEMRREESLLQAA